MFISSTIYNGKNVDLRDKEYVLVNLRMFRYLLVKSITISTKIFSAFSHPIEDTNCTDFFKFKLHTQHSNSILLGGKLLYF